MEHDESRDRDGLDTYELARRTVLKATGGAAALSLGAGTAAASNHGGAQGRGQSASAPNDIDPVFGRPSTGPNPCFGSENGEEHVVHPDCLEQFGTPIRPDHQVELHIGIPGQLLALVEDQSVTLDVGSINAAVNDGSYDGSLEDGNATAAMALANTTGFHFDPVGLHVEPGDVVLFSAESPDHGVSAFHEAHGRQNRVPDGVGPISAPLIPLGGYWLYKFRKRGVYDLYCPPHAAFGMVMRVVVSATSNNPPDLEDSVDPASPPLRPPEESNALPGVLGGLDPEIPSSDWTLEDSDRLEPSNIVSATDGAVHWEDVVAEYRNEN